MMMFHYDAAAAIRRHAAAADSHSMPLPLRLRYADASRRFDAAAVAIAADDAFSPLTLMPPCRFAAACRR